MDTPGFGDSSGRDNQLIAEMMEILDTELGFTNTIVLLIDGNTPRFSSGLYDMLRSVLYCPVLHCTVRYSQADVRHLRGDVVGLHDGGGEQVALRPGLH